MQEFADHNFFMKFHKLAFCLVLLWSLPSWAARPFITDDARLTTAGSCQLESWVRLYQDSREVWALPACNPTGNLEITLGGGQAKDFESAAHTADYVFQFKTLFKPLTPNGWGIGLAAGRVLHPERRAGPNQLGNTYAYLPISVGVNNDQVIVHTNLGWLKDAASSKGFMTWGTGAEIQTGLPRLHVIAETFGDDQNRPYWQSGLRWALIPNLVQLDATFGQQAGGSSSSQWMSFGLRWTPERL